MPWDPSSFTAFAAHRTHCAVLLLFQASIFFVPSIGFADEGTVDFDRDIRPLLSQHCFHCHGPDEAERQADLRLDDGKWLHAAPENADEFLRRILSQEESEVMPPADAHDELDEAEKSKLKAWIEEGADWKRHWAYVAPQYQALPQVDSQPRSGSPVPNFIDYYIQQRLIQNQLSPAPVADASTLVRRLCFDLTGLPPQPEWSARIQEVLASAAGSARRTKAIENLVDQLLDSPHFGERMAIYWLDLVRYADTVGYHGDQDHNASPYRDWVIQAFNNNQPFDQFTIEQLAGDLLPNPTQQQRVATAYNRLLQTSHEGGIQPEEYRAIYAADRVRNFSAVWLAGTVGCAQCHDHKYDPYTSQDFYALAAFFADIDDERHFKNGTNSLPTRREPEVELPTEEQTTKREEFQQNISQLKKQLSELDKEDKDTETLRQQVLEKLKATEQKLKDLQNNIRRCMVTVALKEPRTVRILPRGDWLNQSGSVVQPAAPVFLGWRGTSGADGERKNRLDLAGWLLDSEQGRGLYTARITVNRLWYLFFGAGLARSLDDFGNQGEAPTHPQLLDHLAHEFVTSKWDVKAIIKLIVLSHTYQQSSALTKTSKEVDPENQLFGRQNAFRLPAESIRDNALSVSELLVRDSVGGASVKPPQPSGYYRHLNFPTRKYKPDTNDQQYRRGIYVHWQRQFLHPMLKAFDAPSREECTAQRPRSNTPLAALTLLNDPTFVEAAESLASATLQSSEEDDAQRIAWLWQRVLTRSPTPREVETLQELLSKLRATPQKPSDLSVWTNVCRAILNLAEVNMRY